MSRKSSPMREPVMSEGPLRETRLWPSGAVLAAIRACAVTGVADPVETGQRHQTVSQGDTTTPGFIPSQSRLWSRPAPCPLAHAQTPWICSALIPPRGLSGCRKQIERTAACDGKPASRPNKMLWTAKAWFVA